MDLHKPSPEEVKEYQKKWESSQKDNYVPKEISLKKLFTETYPKNIDIDNVLIKVSALNDLYNTNILSSYIVPVAKHIVCLNIDSILAKPGPDLTLVNKIADKKKIGKEYYSFAAKYCSFHFPEKFPIYDSNVDKALWHFKGKCKSCNFTRKSLKCYSTFYDVLMEFKNFYGLEECTLKQIDQYLWQVGKELKR